MEFKDIILNKCQTPIEDLHLENEPEEVQEQFWDFFYNVPFIQRLTSQTRLYAKDLPRDDSGKIIIDVTQPHILEDMDYFRPAALHYQKYGCYTRLRPNPNPNSEFGKWISEEVRRCREGYVRPSDGEWVTGDFYYFLNYAPMQVIKKKDLTDKKGFRVLSFPSVWEGHYYKFHAIKQARDSGHHYAELASRSKGKSYCAASMLANRFELGESKDVNKKVTCYITADEKKYLVAGDQTLDKFQFNIDWMANNMELPSMRLISSLSNMQWIMGYKDSENGTNRGTLNSVIGVTSKDDPAKLRGSRGVLYVIEEFGTFPALGNLYSNLRPSVEDGDDVFGLIIMYGCVCAGTKVWTNDGRFINIENLCKEDGIIGYENDNPVKNTIGTLLEPRKKPCVRITWAGGKYLECSTDHPILKQTVHTFRVNSTKKRKRSPEEIWVPAEKLKVGDRILEGRYIGAFGFDTLSDARLIGMLIGDGSYGFNNTPTFSNEDSELLDYIKNRYSWSINAEHITKVGKKYQEIRVKGICSQLRNVGIYGQTKTAKRLPTNYQTLTETDTKLLLAGLYDTDGCISGVGAKTAITLTSSTKELLEQVAILLRKFGITSSIVKNYPQICAKRKDKNVWYNLVIFGSENVQLFYENIPLIQRKKVQRLQNTINWFIEHPNKRIRCYDTKKLIPHKIIKIEDIGIQTVYNLSAEQSHTYLANNIITHNTAGDSESDFSSAQELVYNPEGYNIMAFENIYDKEGTGKRKFAYFFPGYLNLASCYDENGNSDVTKALLSILKKRHQIKYNTTDIKAITKAVAEIPITPQEAMLRTRGNIFPVTALNERLNEIDNNPNIYDDVYVGTLVQKSNGDVEFTPTSDLPIRNYPLKDNTETGSFEFYQLPERDNTGKVKPYRYIAGLDPYNNDQAESQSLGSFFVLDLLTDRIVCEYTGRTTYLDEFFEKVRLACIFYNAKCLYESNIRGAFAYFSKMNCVHLLADTPEYLRDKQIIKYSSFGSSSKGVAASKTVNLFADNLTRDWLLKPVVVNYIEDDIPKEKTVPNLMFLKNRALIKELISYNPYGNFDRIRALGMLMLYREEKMILYSGDVSSVNDDPPPEDPDDFFNQNYDERFSNNLEIFDINDDN